MAGSGNTPPPKPWERVGNSSGPSPFRPSSTGPTSTVVESSGVAKIGENSDTERNMPLANRSTVGRPMPARPWEQGSYGSNYGGYGSTANYNSGYGSMTNYNSGYQIALTLGEGLASLCALNQLVVLSSCSSPTVQVLCHYAGFINGLGPVLKSITCHLM